MPKGLLERMACAWREAASSALAGTEAELRLRPPSLPRSTTSTLAPKVAAASAAARPPAPAPMTQRSGVRISAISLVRCPPRAPHAGFLSKDARGVTGRSGKGWGEQPVIPTPASEPVGGGEFQRAAG